MKKIALMIVLLIATLLVTPVFGAGGWEATLKVSVGNAENKLVFGQKADATDGVDGFYDVEALLSGDIEAYFLLEDKMYWRDIRSFGDSIWTIDVNSALEGKEIRLSWNPEDLPSGVNVFLMDDSEENAYDMKTGNGYVYRNDGLRQFRIEVRR